jgi:hypothetical protein
MSQQDHNDGNGNGPQGNGSPHALPMICVADVDTRLNCNSICVTCRFYMRERRRGERRETPRRTRDRRVLARDY